jgi:predicted dehydrogenase
MERANQNPPTVYGFGHIPYLEHVVDCIQNDKPALVDGLEGRRSLELISAIYESVETGHEVSIRFRPEKCRLGHRD